MHTVKKVQSGIVNDAYLTDLQVLSVDTGMGSSHDWYICTSWGSEHKGRWHLFFSQRTLSSVQNSLNCEIGDQYHTYMGLQLKYGI